MIAFQFPLANPPLYGAILLRTFWIALVATAICLLLGFPLALFISRAGPRNGRRCGWTR